MSKVDLAISLAKRASNFVRFCGKEYVLATKPRELSKLSLEGLKFYKPFSADVCTFSKDPSLAQELLEELRHVKGSPAEKVKTIKDRFLLAMGYKNPELVRIDSQTYNMDLVADFMDGSLSVANCKAANETLVALVRHELDHLDKFAIIVKAEGVDVAEAALLEGSKKHFSGGLIKTFDRDFWIKFSKDADITGFDSKKYVEALKNYRYDVTMKSMQTSVYDFINRYHLYCINELEKSAYKIQKKVLDIYGVESGTPLDLYGEKFGKIKRLLKSYCDQRETYEPKGFKGTDTFTELYSAAITMSEPSGIRYLKSLQGIINKTFTPSPEELKQIYNALSAIEIRAYENPKRILAIFDSIYDWLKQGKFTINDII